MTTGTLMAVLTLLVCWNLFLHRKLNVESLRRRELALAFRQLMIERRRFSLRPLAISPRDG